MKISRTVVYAIRALICLGQNGRGAPVACRNLAATAKLPERYLLQILRTLTVHGILDSSRGMEGGYRLNRELDQISLLDVIEVLEGSMCSSDSPNGDSLDAALQDSLKNTVQVARDSLRRVTLANLLDACNQKPGQV